MEINQSNSHKSRDGFNCEQKIIDSRNQENENYLYTNGHRITNQMRWFKGSRDRGFDSDIAA
tara:strand:+ start:363 stop:548 length:186 start_codon:yes stop_codon:yes gene_type:complete